MLPLFALLSLFSVNTFATHLEDICKNALNHQPLFSERMVSYNDEISDFFGKSLYQSPEKVLSIASSKDKNWVLTNTKLIELNNEGSILNETEMYDVRTMALANTQMLLVKNDGEVVYFDLQKKEEIWSTRLNEVKNGKAIAVAFDGKSALVIMTSTSEGGFNGVAKVNLLNGKVITQTAYDYVSAGVIDPEAMGRWSQGYLVLNNGGWIHLISDAQLVKGKPIRPIWRAQPVGTGRELHYMMLKGEFYIEGSNLLGCGYYNERKNDQWFDLTKLFTVKIF